MADMPKTAQQIADMARRAQREGATHYEFSGPSVWFYRTHGGKVERCFAEYFPGPMRYYWVWEPPDDWTECDEIPEGAKPISELLK